MENFYKEEPNRLHLLIHWIVDIIVVVVLAFFTVHLFGSRVTMNGNSMSPVLNSGDVLLMNRLSYDLGKPKRFDIVVFERAGENTSQNIRRIIGLPGETVQISGGFIYINGEILQAEGNLNEALIAGAAEYPIELGVDEYFLLGDNRESSEDSRFSGIGNVKREQIVGKVWLRFQPVSDFGLIDFQEE